MKLLQAPLLFSLAACLGCNPRYDTTSMATLQPAHVPGTYFCDAIWGKATLELRPNHTFHESIHTVPPGSGRIPAGPVDGPTAPLHAEVEGTWALTPMSTSRSGTGVTFKPFTYIQPFGSELFPETTVDLEQGRSGVIRILQQGDMDLYFALATHNPPPPTQPFEQGLLLHR